VEQPPGGGHLSEVGVVVKVDVQDRELLVIAAPGVSDLSVYELQFVESNKKQHDNGR
jgi:hypothetical protein